jgi:hypothetical protein
MKKSTDQQITGNSEVQQWRHPGFQSLIGKLQTRLKLFIRIRMLIMCIDLSLLFVISRI